MRRHRPRTPPVPIQLPRYLRRIRPTRIEQRAAASTHASAAISPTPYSTCGSSVGASAKAWPTYHVRWRNSAAASRRTARSTPAVTACKNNWRNAPITVGGSGLAGRAPVLELVGLDVDALEPRSP